MPKKGLSLIEILLATFITVTVAGAVFSIYPRLFQGVDVSSQKMVAFEAARQEMERLRSVDFNTLLAVSFDPTINQAPIATSFPNGTGFPNSRGVYYVERMHEAGGALIPDLVNVEVVICFLAGRRMVGEDANLNGVLNTGVVPSEDLNGDGRISSLVNLRTLIMRPIQ